MGIYNEKIKYGNYETPKIYVEILDGESHEQMSKNPIF